MAKVAKPDEAGGGATDDAETLVARSRQPALGRQADRALGTLARKIRALRDETRGKGGDEQQVKDLGAALRRVRAEIVRRGEAAAEDDAGEQDQVPAPAAAAAGARAPRSPGIRAGRPTAEYLDHILTRITLPGALYLGMVALIPLIALVLVGANQNFPFGGTSILIIVGVGLETVKQIESQLQQRHYEGFLR